MKATKALPTRGKLTGKSVERSFPFLKELNCGITPGNILCFKCQPSQLVIELQNRLSNDETGEAEILTTRSIE